MTQDTPGTNAAHPNGGLPPPKGRAVSPTDADLLRDEDASTPEEKE